MKKKLIFLVLILMMCLCINTVKAAVFPDKIKVSHSQLFGRYGWNIYKKSYSADGTGGKAFCSSFWNLAPTDSNCTKTTWSNGSDNAKISAGIGYIIDKVRNNDSTITWDNYFYGEMAINKFIYDIYKEKHNTTLKVNNVNGAPKEILNRIKGYVANAKAIYNEYYDKDIIKISGIYLNGEKVNGETVSVDSASKYNLKVVVSCYDKDPSKGGKQIKCDSPMSNGSYSKTALQPYSTKREGKNTIYFYNVTTPVSSQSQIIINASNQRMYNSAQRYKCGTKEQTITPNYLVPGYSSRKTAHSKFKANITAVPVAPEATCESSITTGAEKDPVKNAGLYKPNSNIEKVLDINSPECAGVSSNKDVSCEQSNSYYEEVKQIYFSAENNNASFSNVGNDHFSAFCKSTFKFDNLAYRDNVAENNSLLFEAPNLDKTSNDDDHAFGRAIISVDCNIPMLFDTNNERYDNYNLAFDLNDYIPDVGLELDIDGENKSIQFERGKITTQGCEMIGSKITCLKYKTGDKGYGFSFEVGVNYDYKVSDLSNGYGIIIPETVKALEGGKAKIIFDADKKTKFFNEESNKATCEYDIQNSDIKNKVKYRTIDTKNPFNNINGGSRFTGSNWCEAEQSDDDIGDSVTENDCYMLGDVNRDHYWTMEDSELIVKMVNGHENEFLPEQIALGDYDRNGQIDVLDAVSVQKVAAGITEYSLGDVNMDGIIDNLDVSKIQEYINNTADLNGYQRKMADVNGDCKINGDDEIIIDAISKGNNYVPSEGENIGSDQVQENTNANRCAPNNKTVKKYITNRPDSNGKTPLYKFVLDSSTIKEIRNSNKNYKYNQNSATKTASDSLMDMYIKISDKSGLCYDETNNNGYCDVNRVLGIIESGILE